jgi:hypothetical protein
MSASDELKACLEQLKRVLGEVVADPAAYRIRPELHEPLRAAWSSVRQAFDGAARFLDEVAEDDLAEVGLTGSELALKLTGFDLALQDLQAARVAGGIRGIVKALKKFLNWADVCLDSLAKLLNQADRIAEVKDAIRAAIPDEDEFPDDDTGAATR